jgi:NTE family protein
VGVDVLLDHQRGIVNAEAPDISYDPGRRRGRRAAAAAPPGHRLAARRAQHRAAARGRSPDGALSAVLPQGRGSLAPIGTLVDAVCPKGAWAGHPQTWVVAMDYDSGRRVPFGRDGAPHASLRDAVMASCAIPGWYTPSPSAAAATSTAAPARRPSLDLVLPLELDEVVVLSPMTSLDYDRPVTVAARLERRFRRLITKRLVGEVKKVAAAGTKVTLLGPGAEDLAAIGANLMDPRRREKVLETSLRTSALALRAASTTYAAAG